MFAPAAPVAAAAPTTAPPRPRPRRRADIRARRQHSARAREGVTRWARTTSTCGLQRAPCGDGDRRPRRAPGAGGVRRLRQTSHALASTRRTFHRSTRRCSRTRQVATTRPEGVRRARTERRERGALGCALGARDQGVPRGAGTVRSCRAAGGGKRPGVGCAARGRPLLPRRSALQRCPVSPDCAARRRLAQGPRAGRARSAESDAVRPGRRRSRGRRQGPRGRPSRPSPLPHPPQPSCTSSGHGRGHQLLTWPIASPSSQRGAVHDPHARCCRRTGSSCEASATLRALIVDLVIASGPADELYDACAVLGRLIAERGGSPTIASATLERAGRALGASDAPWLVPARAAVLEGFAAALSEVASRRRHGLGVSRLRRPARRGGRGDRGGPPTDDDEELRRLGSARREGRRPRGRETRGRRGQPARMRRNPRGLRLRGHRGPGAFGAPARAPRFQAGSRTYAIVRMTSTRRSRSSGRRFTKRTPIPGFGLSPSARTALIHATCPRA